MKSDYLIFAVKNLRRRKLRSLLTITGILIAVATIFLLISVSLGLREAVAEQFRLLGGDKFFIVPKGHLAGPGTASAATLTERDVNEIDKVQGVKDLSFILVESVDIKFNNLRRFFQVVAYPADRDKVFRELENYKIDEGKYPSEREEGKVMLGSQYKHNNIFDKPLAAGDKITVKDIDFKVSGIFSSTGDPQSDKFVYFFLQDFKKFSNKTNIDQIIIQVNEGEDLREVAERVEKKLRKTRNVVEKTQDFTVLTPEELTATFSVVLNVVTAFLLAIGAVSLIVGSIGIATTMYTSVLERTREIGVMKAVGAKRNDILMIFLIESGFLGLIGGVFGVILGIAGSKAIAYIASVQLGTTLLRSVIPFYLIAGCLAFAFLIGATSGLFPAYSAARTKPVEALRYE